MRGIPGTLAAALRTGGLVRGSGGDGAEAVEQGDFRFGGRVDCALEHGQTDVLDHVFGVWMPASLVCTGGLHEQSAVPAHDGVEDDADVRGGCRVEDKGWVESMERDVGNTLSFDGWDRSDRDGERRCSSGVQVWQRAAAV